MNWRATVAAGIIFVALLVFVLVERNYRVAEEGEVFRASFLGLSLYGIDAEQVTSLQIHRAGEERLVLEKRDDEWHIVRPFEGLADGQEVMRMVRAVAELRPRASRDGVDLSDEQFGLADADLIASITYNGSKTAALKIGGETPAGVERYAQVTDSDRLYVVGAETRTTLWRNPEDLREKRVAALETDEVRKVTLDHGDEHVVAVRAAGDDEPRWRLTTPLEAAADEWNVRQVINRIGDLRAEDFVAPAEVEQTDTGFDQPQAQVSFERAAGEPLTVTFGRSLMRGEGDEEREHVYVRTSRRDEVMIVTADVLESVRKTAFDLRDRSVVSFKRDEVTRVHVERTEGLSFTIARRPDGWFVEKPESFDARQGAVDDILWNLEDVSAREFVAEDPGERELRQYGLVVPQTSITIEFGRRDEPIEIFVGAESDDGTFYAMTGERDQIVRIGEFLMRDLPEDLSDLRDLPMDLDDEDSFADEFAVPDA